MFFSDPLVALLTSQYAKLTSATLILLREKVAGLHSRTGGQLCVGTGCSGTDIVIHAMQLVLQLWHTVFGIDIVLKHVMSSESSLFQTAVHSRPLQATALVSRSTCIERLLR